MRTRGGILAALVGSAACTGDPTEAAIPGGTGAATSSESSADAGGTASATIADSTGSSDGTDESGSTTPGSDPGDATSTTGEVAACGDGIVQPGQWCWGPAVVLPFEVTPRDVAIGDVDGSGGRELVVATGLELVAVSFDGDAPTRGDAIVLSSTAVAVRCAELDGDGIDDAVALDENRGLWSSRGGAEGLGAPAYVGTAEIAGGLALGDVDQDGNVDAVVSSASASTLMYFRGVGNGTFVYLTIALVGSGSTGVALADFSGDGHLDAAVSTLAASLDLAIYDPAIPTLPTIVPHPTPAGRGSIIAADLDGDGMTDVARLDHQTGSVRLWQGDATGLGDSVDLAVATDARDMAAGDLDADGDVDLLVLTGTALVGLENAGEAEFSAREPVGVDGGTAVRVGVLDRDGVVEVIVIEGGGVRIWWSDP